MWSAETRSRDRCSCWYGPEQRPSLARLVYPGTSDLSSRGLDSEQYVATNQDRLVEAVRQMAGFSVVDNDLPEILTRVAVLANETIKGADLVGLTMSVNGRLQTPAFTDQTSPEIDSVQYDTGVGPSLDAYRYGAIHVIPSTVDDVQWRPFSDACLAHGVLSTLSVPVKSGEETLGVLNCYARQEEVFERDAQTMGMAFAEQAGIVIRNAQAYWEAKTLGEQLMQALESRVVIEQAKGLLMATGMTSSAAFDVLREASQRGNRKLLHVAADLVAKAELRGSMPDEAP